MQTSGLATWLVGWLVGSQAFSSALPVLIPALVRVTHRTIISNNKKAIMSAKTSDEDEFPSFPYNAKPMDVFGITSTKECACCKRARGYISILVRHWTMTANHGAYARGASPMAVPTTSLA
jgi:hypothetical protein